MSSNFRLEPEVEWINDCSCTFQLIAYAKAKWYILPRSLTHFHVIASHSPYGFGVICTQDGRTIYLTDDSRKLQRIRIDNDQLIPIEVKDITPIAWQSKDPSLVSGCLGVMPGEYYCLMNFGHERHLSLWFFSDQNDCQVARLLFDQLPFTSVDLFCTADGPISVRANYPRVGMIQIINLHTLMQRNYELSLDERLNSVSISYSGKRCLFSTGIQTPEGKLWSRDLDTSELQFLTHAGYGSWSPDESYIAATRADQQLLLLNRQVGTVEAVISAEPFYGEDRLPWLAPLTPRWSPDGEWIVFFLCQWGEPETSAQNKGLKVVQQATFVLNKTNRAILRLPFFCENWVWIGVKSDVSSFID